MIYQQIVEDLDSLGGVSGVGDQTLIDPMMSHFPQVQFQATLSDQQEYLEVFDITKDQFMGHFQCVFILGQMEVGLG